MWARSVNRSAASARRQHGRHSGRRRGRGRRCHCTATGAGQPVGDHPGDEPQVDPGGGDRKRRPGQTLDGDGGEARDDRHQISAQLGVHDPSQTSRDEHEYVDGETKPQGSPGRPSSTVSRLYADPPLTFASSIDFSTFPPNPATDPALPRPRPSGSAAMSPGIWLRCFVLPSSPVVDSSSSSSLTPTCELTTDGTCEVTTEPRLSWRLKMPLPSDRPAPSRSPQRAPRPPPAP